MSEKSDYDKGYDRGYKEGYDEGHQDGVDETIRGCPGCADVRDELEDLATLVADLVREVPSCETVARFCRDLIRISGSDHRDGVVGVINAAAIAEIRQYL